MKEIPLTQGQIALVSNEWFDYLNKWKWYARWDPHGQRFYAQRNERGPNGKRFLVLMHRVIISAPKGVEVDHIDLNGCNNQCNNLRIAPKTTNRWNRPRNRNNKSGIKGVSWYPNYGKWTGSVMANGKKFSIGYFEKKEDAILARNEKAKQLHGEFAYCDSL